MTDSNPESQPTTPAARVLEEAAAWPGVTTRTTPRGATAIMLDDRELGHVHPDRATLDLPLDDERRAEVLREGRAKEWFSDWVSKPIVDDADATDGLALLRESYEQAAH